MAKVKFDLNKPKDARAFVSEWVKTHEKDMAARQVQLRIKFNTDEEMLILAKQLFLHHDHPLEEFKQ